MRLCEGVLFTDTFGARTSTPLADLISDVDSCVHAPGVSPQVQTTGISPLFQPPSFSDQGAQRLNRIYLAARRR